MAALGRTVAVFTAGVVGTGEYDQGVPALVECLRALASNNDITVYSMHAANKAQVPSGIRMRELPFRTPFHRLNLILLSAMLIVDHLRCHYELIHTIAGLPYGAIGVFLGRLLRVPCLVVLLGGELASLPGIGFGELRIASRARKLAKTCRCADELVTLSRFQANGLAEVGVPPNRSVVIPFGVDTRRFPYYEKTLQAPYTFLHVSYAQAVKDVETLLETFRIVSEKLNAELLIVGQNHIGQKTEKLIGELSLRPKVKLVGSVPNQRIAEYLRRAHFLLHTSRYESQGVVFNEAMSAGVVVCATRVGLAFDLADGHCVSSDVGDSLRLASEIIDTINDEEHYKKLRSNGRQWCVSHDVMNTVAAYNEIYQRL